MLTLEDTDLAHDLRALAKRVLADVPELPWPGRGWWEDALATTMLTYAEIHSERPRSEILAACESYGRLKAADYAARGAASGA